MAAEKRRRYEPKFREGAARIVIERGKPIAQVARDLGIGEGTLGSWVARARKASKGTESGLTPRRAAVDICSGPLRSEVVGVNLGVILGHSLRYLVRRVSYQPRLSGRFVIAAGGGVTGGWSSPVPLGSLGRPTDGPCPGTEEDRGGPATGQGCLSAGRAGRVSTRSRCTR